MITIDDVINNAIVSLIITILASISTIFYQRWKYRQQNLVLRKLLSDDYSIILPNHALLKTYDFCGMVGIGDSMALLELQRHMHLDKHIFDRIVYYSGQEKSIDLDKNLIIIGGPGSNLLTATFMKEINTGYSFEHQDDLNVTIFDRVRKTYAHPASSGGSLALDVGYIIVADNPYKMSRRVILLFGCFGYGTWAAMQALFLKQFMRKIKKNKYHNFEACVEVEIRHCRPHHIEIKDIRDIE